MEDAGVALLPSESEEPCLELDIDDVLETCSNGLFQARLAFCVALAWSFNSLVTMVTPFFLAGMRKDLGLSALQEGLTAAAVLLGMVLGNSIIGALADQIGRRPCVILSVLGTGLTNAAIGAIDSLSWEYVALLRVGVGFFIAGSMVPSNSLVSELVPRSSRGRWLAFLHVFWQFGTLTMVLMSYELRGRSEWRDLMLASSAPSAAIVMILFCLLPESPRYYLVQGRPEEAVKGLESVAEVNSVRLPTGWQLAELPAVEAESTTNILSGAQFMQTTLPLWSMFFWLNYAAYGLSMWLKAYLVEMDMGSEARKLYGVMALGKILGVLACVLVIEWMPRRTTLTGFFGLAALSMMAAVTATGGKAVPNNSLVPLSGDMVVLILFATVALFEEAAWGAIYTYSAEVYPSSIRSTGSGAAMAFGRFGGILATTIGRALLDQQPRMPFYLVAIAFGLAALSAQMSRTETRGEKLTDV